MNPSITHLKQLILTKWFVAEDDTVVEAGCAFSRQVFITERNILTMNTVKPEQRLFMPQFGPSLWEEMLRGLRRSHQIDTFFFTKLRKLAICQRWDQTLMWRSRRKKDSLNEKRPVGIPISNRGITLLHTVHMKSMKTL